NQTKIPWRRRPRPRDAASYLPPPSWCYLSLRVQEGLTALPPVRNNSSLPHRNAMLDIRRRDLITLIVGAVAWPMAAHPQQSGKLPTIGFLGSATASAWTDWVAAFVGRL